MAGCAGGDRGGSFASGIGTACAAEGVGGADGKVAARRVLASRKPMLLVRIWSVFQSRVPERKRVGPSSQDPPRSPRLLVLHACRVRRTFCRPRPALRACAAPASGPQQCCCESLSSSCGRFSVCHWPRPTGSSAYSTSHLSTMAINSSFKLHKARIRGHILER